MCCMQGWAPPHVVEEVGVQELGRQGQPPGHMAWTVGRDPRAAGGVEPPHAGGPERRGGHERATEREKDG